MSSRSLLFSAQIHLQARKNVSAASRAAEREVFVGADTEGQVWVRASEGSDDYLLPSGIVSMEHWLDLNA